MTLRSKVLRGSVWVVAFRWFARALGLINVAIIARILGPEDFGLVAMAMLVLGLIEAWLAFGLENACVQREHLTREHLDTAWSMRLIQGIVVTLLIVIAAPFAAKYFRDERVTLLIWVLSSGIFIASLGNIGVVMFRREMNFHSEFKLQVAARLIGFALGLGAVLWLRNYWGLVIGMLSGIAATAVLSYAMHPFRPRWDLSRWRELWNFSKWMFIVNIAQFAETRVDEAVVGRLGASELGLYSVASDLGQMPVNEIAAPVNRVLFPAFASVQGDPERLRAAYLRTLEAVAAVTFPAGVGLALVAKPAIAMVLGVKWLPAAGVLSLIALFAVCRSLASTASSLFFAQGRPATVAAISFFGLACFLVLSTFLSSDNGAWGVALAKLIAGGFAAAASMAAVVNHSRVTARDLAVGLFRPGFSSACMAIVLLELPDLSALGTAAGLFVQIILGAVAYAGSSVLAWALMGRPDGAERILLSAVTTVIVRRNHRANSDG